MKKRKWIRCKNWKRNKIAGSIPLLPVVSLSLSSRRRRVLLQIWWQFNQSVVSPFPSFREGGVAESRGGRWIHNADNKRFMHSPTTSPYGDSSFPKEENGDTTDWLNCHQI
ncbi:hypothetical protein [Bacteroides caccae]|uniref:Uncharacterized protein n=1 Tax=Bacteroides caccae TaxID=47678 RepID=A0A9P4A815_9BACE|nr:hypothetical protein [Bacteroides caccae]KAA2318843.1 hypothetical protein F2Y29_09985 [Bacteroides caccae]KAA2321142.1 hypothetical protein F2Y20_12415 [Bacteroides caccae]KAA2329241.1 hypothetical protein F2Y42_09105 [Bacteroides caccae]KAA2333482.1 hypothetical protein F2Y21_07755 [Bacteroides caccae]KAA2337891.1 hypothetical protein F2Y23_02060 [Bacteroides caccae]